MACPKGIDVTAQPGGQTVGTEGAPAAIGATVRVEAEPSGSGTFDGPVVLASGNALFPQTRPDGQPAIASGAAFEFEVTAPEAGAYSLVVGTPLTGCSYPFHVSGALAAPPAGASCPAAAAAEPATAERGDTVVVRASVGAFAGTGGTAEFRDPTGTQPARQATVVAWSSSAVEVQVPSNLGGGDASAFWTLFLTPTGAAEACGPFGVSVLPDAVVPPSLCDPDGPVAGLLRESFRVRGLGSGGLGGIRLRFPVPQPPIGPIPQLGPLRLGPRRLEPGEALELEVVRLPADNALTDALEGNATIRFELSLRRGSDAAPANTFAIDDQPRDAGAVPLTVDRAVRLKLRPRIRRLTGAEPSGRNWTLTVSAEISRLPGCRGPVRVTLQTATLTQLDLLVPELVIGFQRTNQRGHDVCWEPDAIVFAHPGVPGLDGVIDKRDGTPAVEAARDHVLGLLEGLQAAVTALAPFAPTSAIPAVGRFDADQPIGRAIATLTNAELDRLTFDSSASHRDLNDDRDHMWADRIDSLVAIGVPDGSRLVLRTDPDQAGRRMDIRLPDDDILGAVNDLGKPDFTEDVVARKPDKNVWGSRGILNEISSFLWRDS